MIEDKFLKLEAPWQPAYIKNWRFTQIKHHYEITLGKMLQNSAQSSEDVEVPYLKAQHIQWDQVLTEELPTMWASPGEIEMLRVRKGDLLVCEGGEVGRAVIVTDELPRNCIIQNALHLVRPRQTGDLRFLRYLLLHATSHEWLDVICNKATIAHFTVEKFSQMWIWLPPLSEQCAIANYLDHETAKINTLISAKESLLELLEEKRQALITHIVTYGLNPDVPMQRLSFDFLNSVPKHWKVINLKFLGELRTGVTKGRNFGNREPILVPYLRVANVQDGYLDLSDIAQIEVLPEEISSFKLEKGDVLMNEGGDADKLGRGAVWDGSIEPCLHQNHVFALRCYNIEPDWLTTIISSNYLKAYFESRSKQSTNLASISATNVKELPIVVPPSEERKAIIEYLKVATSEIDRLRKVAISTIKLLRERHTALITAAVTGQIKVKA
ncbi:MAG: restriction endonuclease subunit S [Aulosira sp. ZfuVER01]|nr:restriction endonuclease subunit S [Aulosira sp. ZfuVER01]MDZ7997702.1 restriction endonuclease subunit S [Aulosira sp. DedVER01a]MDZ8052197.1 restriction endonuclease subunit S [Aulosira sp. ZfuCHP01]